MRSSYTAGPKIQTYDEFIKEVYREGWQFLDHESPHIITNKDTAFVSTHPVMTGGYGPFLELKCPQKHAIAINGAIQEPFLLHTLAIRCRDDTDFELPGETMLSMMYFNNTGKPRGNLWVSYAEISQTTGSRFKQEGERYYLKERGILLNGGEKLAFYVYESDIDIDKVDISLKCDIFVKEGKGAKK